jgi:hypothetical protein
MISVFSIEESERWDDIVKNFKNFDIYYLSGYSKAFKIHGDGEPLLLYYVDEKIKAINVVMKRDIAKDKNFIGELKAESYFDITTPYGYGGFLIEGEITNRSLECLNNEYQSWCKRERIVSEFVRFHPILKNNELLDDMYGISKLGKTVSMKLNTREQLWNDITGKNRNMIRKAQKSGVEIFWGRDSWLFEKFIHLYNATMEKDNAKSYYYFKRDFYKSILNDLKYNSIIFYGKYDGEIIAMTIILYSNKQLHYHLSASDKEYQNLAPTNLLLYEAACWGCENGYKSFHLGGGLGSREDNLYKFKKAFNKKLDNIFAIGEKIFDEEIYQQLIEIRKRNSQCDEEVSFFPLYRV